ncbi:hypothetical protein PLESTB_001209500 [Pleodorina starrii]|uniref:Uncharacterized protein n=1 Tax=Pleodorina starrii TaxID=330485 RepID=A0A9W6BSA6_9CHLO|nr:hypothetical protein PLESTM_001649600 [Pleodorina starrii]GLC57302.1 hypothetical protein PLESTB_001209500 [Pleodorina starrii]GLC71299.1 hypothetical protein PLESTF_001100500 [Pleodorina starrii]
MSNATGFNPKAGRTTTRQHSRATTRSTVVRRPVSFTCSLWRSEGGSERERKDPSKWRSIEELREYLERPQGVPGGFSSFLNWISQNAFGGGTEPRGFAALYRWLLRLTPGTTGYLAGRKVDVAPEVLMRARGSPLVSILLISPEALAVMATKVPGLLAMSVDEAVERLTGLKVLLPSCDISHLVATEPRLYLEAPRVEVEEQLRCSLSLLSSFALPPEVVQEMISHDPGLPWVVTERGLAELRQLWPPDLVDTQALRDSDPRELALAVRALSTRLR